MTARGSADNECPTCGQVIPPPDFSQIMWQVRRQHGGSCHLATCPVCADFLFEQNQMELVMQIGMGPS